jgi:type IV pilus assembly protein PilW
MAMGIIANVIQNGGYFASATTQAANAALPAAGSFATAGQAISGTAATGTVSDNISVRYLAGTADGVADCLGATNSSGANQMDVNTLYVDKAKQQLICSVQDGAAAVVTSVLASGVSDMNVWYGVSPGGNSAVQYIPTASMTAANWSSVVSVKVSLTLVPPVSTMGSNLLPAAMSVNLTRVVDLLNRV